MTVENQNYELHILNYAINKYIDNILPSNSQDALNVIIYQSDDLVWRVATEIYTKSGYKIDFSWIQDILNLRIEPLKFKIAEQERIRKQKAKQEKFAEFKKAYPYIDLDIERLEIIFIKLRNVVIEHLEVDEDQVTLDSHIMKDLGADDLDAVELLYKMEEEFDIEIPEDPSLCNIGKFLEFVCQEVKTYS